MVHVNRFFCVYPSLKNVTVTNAMLKFFAWTNQRIIQFSYAQP